MQRIPAPGDSACILRCTVSARAPAKGKGHFTGGDICLSNTALPHDSPCLSYIHQPCSTARKITYGSGIVSRVYAWYTGSRHCSSPAGAIMVKPALSCCVYTYLCVYRHFNQDAVIRYLQEYSSWRPGAKVYVLPHRNRWLPRPFRYLAVQIRPLRRQRGQSRC